ncbi:hypothetical protein ACFCW2_11200 [Qipengyuania sp. DSG2-2]|uniref:hypothetical protein n=1 Tax=Qipengyuania sp. DGS2-2 TaxID=3349631 RepID=UPI0036D43E61
MIKLDYCCMLSWDGLMLIRLFSIIAFLLLSACSQQQMIDKLSSKEEQDKAIEVTEMFRSGSAAELAEISHPEFAEQLPVLAPQIEDYLLGVKGQFSIENVSSFASTQGPTQKQFIAFGGIDDRWAIAEINFAIEGEKMTLLGVYVEKFDENPKTSNHFKAGGRGLTGYFWLLMMGLSMTVCLVAAVLVWRGERFRYRPIWTIVALLAVGKFELNWAAGDWAFSPANIQLLGAGAVSAGPFAPWMLTFGLPLPALGIIGLWITRRPKQPLGE